MFSLNRCEVDVSEWGGCTSCLSEGCNQPKVRDEVVGRRGSQRQERASGYHETVQLPHEREGGSCASTLPM
jgi:hypothetical protein